MTKLRTILENLQDKAIASGNHSCGNLEEDKKDIDEALSQLRSAMKEMVPKEDECYCKQYPGEPTCIDKFQQLCAACYRNTTIRQIHARIDKECL